MPSHRDTIVIGASLGGIAALRVLLAAWPADLPASVLVVLHQARGAGRLDAVLREASRLPLDFVRESTPIAAGRVYLAPPDRHLIVADDVAKAVQGPREMRARPAINPLFRTAAAARGGRVIALQLTGLLDDGVDGLDCVKRCGGLVLVQDPGEAECPDMPLAAIDAVEVDHVAPLARLAERVQTIVRERAPEAVIPEDIRIEARLSGTEPSRQVTVGEIGEQVPVACPDCGGPLWQTGCGGTGMFRCHVGHALSGRALLDAQSDDIERSLWVAVRSLSERAAMLGKLADNTSGAGSGLAAEYRRHAGEAMDHSETARRFLLSLQGGVGRSDSIVAAPSAADADRVGHEQREVGLG